jgi:uncharacterized membrane protein YkvA (DUF1232 family)
MTLWQWGLIALVVYLSMPFDLVSDFIPVAGQLDDAIIVALLLRAGFPKLALTLFS